MWSPPLYEVERGSGGEYMRNTERGSGGEYMWKTEEAGDRVGLL